MVSMKHLGTQILETERLTLRPLEMTDAQEMFDNWTSNPNVSKYVTWHHHENVATTEYFLKIREEAYKNKDFYDWGIVLKENQTLIGTITIVDCSEKDLCMTLGYCIGENWWNQGYVTEAGQTVIDFLFSQVGCHRVEAVFDINNPASGRVMQKLGMHYEGRRREAKLVKGVWRSLDCYGILVQDWKRIKDNS